jgi:hypothetical protein
MRASSGRGGPRNEHAIDGRDRRLHRIVTSFVDTSMTEIGSSS